MLTTPHLGWRASDHVDRLFSQFLPLIFDYLICISRGIQKDHELPPVHILYVPSVHFGWFAVEGAKGLPWGS